MSFRQLIGCLLSRKMFGNYMYLSIYWGANLTINLKAKATIKTSYFFFNFFSSWIKNGHIDRQGLNVTQSPKSK